MLVGVQATTGASGVEGNLDQVSELLRGRFRVHAQELDTFLGEVDVVAQQHDAMLNEVADGLVGVIGLGVVGASNEPGVGSAGLTHVLVDGVGGLRRGRHMVELVNDESGVAGPVAKAHQASQTSNERVESPAKHLVRGQLTKQMF